MSRGAGLPGLTLLLLPLLAVLLAAGCGEQGSPPAPGGSRAAVLTVDYPLDESVFPPDFTPPTFLWHDTSPARSWSIVVTFSDGGEPLRAISSGPPPERGEIDPEAVSPTNEIYEGTPYQRSAHCWTPMPELWAEIQRRSVEGPATLSIEGFAARDESTVLSRGEVRITTSRDPVGAPIFYRDVLLMPAKGEDGKIAPLSESAIPLISWRLRDLSRPRSKVVLTDMPTCANCHSFSADGNTLGMDVDGPQGDKGTYAIAPLDKTTVIDKDEVITWNSFEDKPEGHRTLGFLSRISPDGAYAITTVNEALYVTNFMNYEFLQVFYPTRGILAWYSIETGEMKALPGADDPEYVHCDPVWFPGGEELVFARAKAFDPYRPGQVRAKFAGDPNEPRILFDLYRMPFAKGKGGTPVPIEGASANGMSNTFPKVSPDGRWLVWTRCANGQLMRPDGRLWIVSTDGGEAREMRCNTSRMNSWHSFSPNSRWLVFSSKVNTPYTQMLLTHIDADGHDSPAILIPHSTAANRAVNIPEFVNRDYDEFDAIDVPAVEHHRLLRDGLNLLSAGSHQEAARLLEAALEEDPGSTRAMVALAFARLEEGRSEEARKLLSQAIELDPGSAIARVNLGVICLGEGQPDQAASYFEKAIELDPKSHLAHHNLGLVLLDRDELEAAQDSLAQAARLQPEDANYRNALGFVRQRLGRTDDAIADYRAALELDPRHRLARTNIAAALVQSGEAAEALTHLEALLESTPDDVEIRRDLAWLLATLPGDGARDGERAVRLAEQCRKTLGDRVDILDVLAAAYAEAGRFPDAVKTAERALELASTPGGSVAAPGLAERLEGYREGRPCRQR